MAQGNIAVVGQSGELNLGTTLSRLLALTSDAVVCFDAQGIILLANDEATKLFASGEKDKAEGLVGKDIWSLFAPACASDAQGEQLPFSTDGTSSIVSLRDVRGRALPLVIRCERVGLPSGPYLLIAHPSAADTAADAEHERLMAELSRANRRLAGTLDIVLGTLDSPSVSVLFERVLERLKTTMDALGTCVYLSERDGFHLRGTSASLSDVAVPRYLPRRAPLWAAVIGSEQALRLRVLPPEGESLRKGRLSRRNVMDEESRAVYSVRTSQLPPFGSFLAVSVRFGGHVIALIQVGWRGARTIPCDDANLLDAVTRYLAVQLVGAFSALRTQRREQLARQAADLRDALVVQPFGEKTRLLLLDSVSRDLDCVCAPIDGPSALDGHEVLHLPVSHEEVAVPSELLSEEGGVTALLPDAPLARWLAERGEPCMGALVDDGTTEDARVRFLALRPYDAEPFDDLELGYLRQVADTVAAVTSGEQVRRRDHRISQALQSGMRSQLQQVEGISSQGIYSSATESAFVGGDFYDLIRLPDRHACVIMGDVSGKGVEAASVSAAVRTALGAYSWEGLNPAHMVSLLNDFLLGFSRVETFATLFVGIIDLHAGQLTYCSAGHPPAILLRAANGELEWLEEQSGVVGAFPDMSYHDGFVSLATGDVLLLYTDGTTEARAEDGRFFGEDGLRDAVMREGALGFDGLLDRLLATVEAFTGNHMDDDVAMVALRFDKVGDAL